MIRALAFGAVLLLAAAATARAQVDFSTSGVRVGDFVYVTPAAGAEVSGRVEAITPGSLSVGGYLFKPEPGLIVQRRGDSVWDGAWKGLAVGAVATVTVAALNDDLDGAPGFLAYTALPWMFWGALVDWLHVGRTTVFDGDHSRNRARR
jgi:hypothetical protein